MSAEKVEGTLTKRDMDYIKEKCGIGYKKNIEAERFLNSLCYKLAYYKGYFYRFVR